MRDLPVHVRVQVEVPRFGFVKREAGLGVDFVSPVPSPFNYGSVPGTRAPDGDPLDAVVLGPRLPLGAVVEVPVRGVVRFEDQGVQDDKLVCGVDPLRPVDRAALIVFFATYARARTLLDRLRGRGGTARFCGLDVP